jgi:hypothetical protein
VFPKSTSVVLGLCLALSACLKSNDVPKIAGGVASSALTVEYSASPRADVKRKRADLLRNSLAKILVLHPQGLCMELGRLPCADLVHKVSLGGMNAYGNAQYRYPERASVSSAMSLDRLVLSACIQRAQLDLVNPAQGIIFKDIELSADGRLVKNDAVTTAIHTLYQRAFLRDASAAELQNILKFYEDVYAEQPIGAARNWMVLSCYSVLSSVEAAFH